MNFTLGRTKKHALPGRNLQVRVHRTLGTLISRVEPGDLVVIDQLDLDAETARSLAERRPYAVLNASAFISGRFANLGPEVLTSAGIVLLQASREQALALRDGSRLRLHDGTLYDGAIVLLDVEELTGAQVLEAMQRARTGLAVQLESFAHSASELLHREEGLLLHGTGLPSVSTRLNGRVAVVVGPAARAEDLRRLRRFLRRSDHVLLGVDGGLSLLLELGLRPEIGVLSGATVVSDRAVRRCREVILVEPRAEAGRTAASQVEKLNLPMTVVTTTTAPVDLAMLVARHGGARLVVPIGTPKTLDEFIDRDRNDQASNVLTRLRLGADLIEGASAATVLRSAGGRRTGLLAGALVVAAVVGVGFTPVGRTARENIRDRIPESWTSQTARRHDKAEIAARDHRIAALQAQARDVASYTDATAAAVVRGSLSGRAVSFVILPGAEPAAVTSLRKLVTAAGGQVTGEVTVLPAAVSAASSGLVDALTSQMLTQAPDVKVPGGADEYERFGALLARSAGLPSAAHLQRAAPDAHAVAIGSGLKAAGLLSASVTQRAALTLIVAPGTTTGASSWAAIAASYASQVPTVVAGPGAGVLDAVQARGSKAFSTVAGIGTTDEQVVAVLALAARTHGTVGSYGAASKIPSP